MARNNSPGQISTALSYKQEVSHGETAPAHISKRCVLPRGGMSAYRAAARALTQCHAHTMWSSCAASASHPLLENSPCPLKF